MRFEGRVAVVTGGGSGIGAATARRLAAEGAAVWVADRNAEGAREVAAEVGGTALEVDVADDAAVRAAFDTVGPVDILVNNAGIDRWGFFASTTPEYWHEVMAVNLMGVMSCTQAVLAGMHERGRGAIVSVASEAGRAGSPGGVPYSASKAGVIGFTRALARESARYGVRVNAVAPGPIETPLLMGAGEQVGEERAERMRAAMTMGTAMRRLGTPDEVAAAIAFLASDDASYVTGQTLNVSGGLTMA
jgi:2-hydroxycyclohexanecarboxyl-CoA dehydrogenase